MSIDWKTSNGIESAIADSAAELIEALRPSNSHWWEDGSCPWVFRGHAREEWSLLPSAWRSENPTMKNCIMEASRRFEVVSPVQMLSWHWPGNGLISTTPIFDHNFASLAKKLTIETTAEYLPIWDFVANCDALGMHVPLPGFGPDPIQDPNWLAHAHYPLVGDELLSFSEVPAALALAQHHGIPTRLLDWTRNPIAAAFFAVERLREPNEGSSLVVWALHRRHAKDVAVNGVSPPGSQSDAQRLDPKIQIVRPSTRDNPFLAAQAGLFTTISLSAIYFMKSGGQRPTLEAFVAEADPALNVLRKITLSHKHADDLREILHRENVSRSAFMPTMDNVARDVLIKWARQA